MRKYGLTLLILSSLFSFSHGFDALKMMQKALEREKQNKDGTQSPLPFNPLKQGNNEQTLIDTSCKVMLDNTPKNSLANETAKNVLKGAATGAIIGGLFSRDRGKGAIIGAITGAGVAVAYSALKTKHLQPESPKDTAKRLGYDPSMGELLNFELLPSEVKSYKIGEYADIVLRISLLTPEALQKKDNQKDELIPIWVNSYLVKDGGILYPLSSESYYLIPGTSALPYYLPICDEIKPGNYKLRFQITGLGREVSREVDFRVSSK